MNANRIDARALVTYVSLPRKRIRQVEYTGTLFGPPDEPSHLIHEVKKQAQYSGKFDTPSMGIALEGFPGISGYAGSKRNT